MVKYVDLTTEITLVNSHQIFPKLQALRSELERRSRNDCENLSEHYASLSSLVWFGITVEGFREITIGLERFNRVINHLSAGIYDEDSSQIIAHKWVRDDIQAILGATKHCVRWSKLFDKIVQTRDGCTGHHRGLLHLSSTSEIELLLSSCSHKTR